MLGYHMWETTQKASTQFPEIFVAAAILFYWNKLIRF